MINSLPKSLIDTATKVLTTQPNNVRIVEAEQQTEEKSPQSEVEQFRQKWKNAGVDNFVSGKYDNINLSSVVVPKHAQNQGIGTKYMQDLSALADKLGKTVTTSPSSDFGGTKSRLIKFYKQHGFVENKGRNKDFTTSETMYRLPKEYKGQAPHHPDPISAPTEKPLPPVKDTVISKHMKSPEFHEWFAGSKVTNGMGDPVVAYHGSPDIGKLEDSGAFNHKEDGIFFTNDITTAKSYTDEKRSSNYQEAKGGVISTHLNIKNPYYHDHQGKEWFGTEKVIADAKAKGHDGVIINNVVDHYNTNKVKKIRPSTVFVVFNPKQIKHATQNNGAHSPNTSNIFE